MSSIPIRNIMNVSATTLKENSPVYCRLTALILRHIRSIEQAIREKHRTQDDTPLIYEIEQNFEVPEGMKNATAQRFVYSGIIDQLLMNKFEVRLRMTTKRNYFEISWLNELDRDEIQRQINLIKDVTI